MVAPHWPAVREIYALGIATGHATFEVEPPAWGIFDADHLVGHRYVAVDHAGEVLGWIDASPVSGRCVYSGVVEHSVYVHPLARGRGVGRLLLGTLIDSTERAGIWTIQSGVFPENAPSLALHRGVGFRDVGVRGLGCSGSRRASARHRPLLPPAPRRGHGRTPTWVDLPRGQRLRAMNAADLAALPDQSGPKRIIELAVTARRYRERLADVEWTLVLGVWDGIGALQCRHRRGDKTCEQGNQCPV